MNPHESNAKEICGKCGKETYLEEQYVLVRIFGDITKDPEDLDNVVLEFYCQNPNCQSYEKREIKKEDAVAAQADGVPIALGNERKRAVNRLVVEEKMDTFREELEDLEPEDFTDK